MQKLLILFFVLILNHSTSYSQQEKSNSISILFIGNSLTYTNNLPKLVKKNASLHGVKISTKMIAYANYAIEDHWNDKKVQQLISSKKFDYVIIQQGPSSQDNGRKMLIEYGEKFSSLCKLNNIQLCYFMVWPSISYYHTFDGVIKNHRDAAIINSAILLPVGKIWKEHIDTSNSYNYYGPDMFHPSLKGSKAAAKVIVAYLFKE